MDFRFIYFSYLLLLLSASTVCTTWGQAQQNMSLFQLGDSLLNKHGYRSALDAFETYRTATDIDSMPFAEKNMQYQAMMTFYSIFGDHTNALYYEDKAFPFQRSRIDSYNSKVNVHDAITYVGEHFANGPVLMINEAHNRSQCRAFMASLLPVLYAKGYRYLAVEALDYKDTLLNKRKFPVQQSGYYVREPTFGQLIRQALALGFSCIPYEDTTRQPTSANDRERTQADNLYRFINTHPGARLVVYAGHDHIHKAGTAQWTPMAERLCRLTGRNIPALDCTTMLEHYDRKYESRFYSFLADTLHIDAPSILTYSDTAYVTKKLKGKVDACIFLPRTNMQHVLPDWMNSNSKYSYTVTLPPLAAQSGALLQVYLKAEWIAEGSDAIPVIQYVLPGGQQTYTFNLPIDAYLLFVRAKGNTILYNTDLIK